MSWCTNKGNQMKKKRILILLILIFFGITFFACADKAADNAVDNTADSAAEEAEDSEKGVIEKFTSKTAKEAVKAIRTPINKARAAKKVGENKMNNMDEMVNQ
jgi:hypothetical protein